MTYNVIYIMKNKSFTTVNVRVTEWNSFGIEASIEKDAQQLYDMLGIRDTFSVSPNLHKPLSDN